MSCILPPLPHPLRSIFFLPSTSPIGEIPPCPDLLTPSRGFAPPFAHHTSPFAVSFLVLPAVSPPAHQENRRPPVNNPLPAPLRGPAVRVPTFLTSPSLAFPLPFRKRNFPLRADSPCPASHLAQVSSFLLLGAFGCRHFPGPTCLNGNILHSLQSRAPPEVLWQTRPPKLAGCFV